MQDVVTHGTARIARYPVLMYVLKQVLRKTIRSWMANGSNLPNNSMFVCFAPKENPKIAIAVAVENAGFGATWGGPIARILMEKYLNDTISRKK